MIKKMWKKEMDFDRRVEAEIPVLKRYAHKLMRDHATAEELVQECLVRGLSKQHLWCDEAICTHGCARFCTTYTSMKSAAWCGKAQSWN
jgi:hypothetical protein